MLHTFCWAIHPNKNKNISRGAHKIQRYKTSRLTWKVLAHHLLNSTNMNKLQPVNKLQPQVPSVPSPVLTEYLKWKHDTVSFKALLTKIHVDFHRFTTWLKRIDVSRTEIGKLNRKSTVFIFFCRNRGKMISSPEWLFWVSTTEWTNTTPSSSNQDLMSFFADAREGEQC